jgi:hypothetical protein
MQFLYGRHPEIGMPLELVIKPRGSGFLRSHAQKVGTCAAGEAIEFFSVVVIAVTVISVAVITVAGFEWPVPTHRAIFSIPDLKSKPGM